MPSLPHSMRKTSVVRYSAPGITGVVKTRVASSPSVGGGTFGMACDGEVPAAATCESPHSPPKYRAAKSRHQTKHGGST